jgi:hypothetical protein
LQAGADDGVVSDDEDARLTRQRVQEAFFHACQLRHRQLEQMGRSNFAKRC